MTIKGMAILKRSFLLLIFIGFITGGVFFSLNRIEFEENIASILPADENNKFLIELLDSADFFDRIIFHVSMADSLKTGPSLLTSVANSLCDSITQKFYPEYISKIEGKADIMQQYKLLEAFYKYLPLYLEEKDYTRIDSLMQYGDFDKMLGEYIKLLNSPAGMMVSRFLFRDPLNLVPPQLNRLKDLQIDENLVIYQNYLFTKDKKHLLFFVTPNDAGNTGKNTKFIGQLDQTIHSISASFGNQVKIEYLGSLPMAAANAIQIKKDIRLTVTIAIVLIVLLIYYFFRRISILWLILLPAFFGATVALIVFAIFSPEVSAISLGIGSVLLGITVDYSLHLLTHLKHTDDVGIAVKKVAVPIIISSLTTAVAFLCLQLLSSPALRQLGMFAAISVVSAAIASILFLPLFLRISHKSYKANSSTLLEKIASFDAGSNFSKVIFLAVVTIVMFFFAQRTEFEKDIEKSSFVPKRLKEADENLMRVSELNQKKIYLLSSGTDLNEALKNSETNNQKLETLLNEGKISAVYRINTIIFSKQKQEEKIEQWRNFWTADKIARLKRKLDIASSNNHFKPNAFDVFYNVLQKSYSPVAPDSLFDAFGFIADNFRIPLSDRFLVASVIRITNNSQKEAASEMFRSDKTAYVLDRKDFFLKIFDLIQVDFNKLINYSLIVVFLIILFFFGRIEIAVITFLPILISWLWTMGIMGLTGTKINYFNIVICTLIFGLGIDYSVFITKGLLHKFKYGNNDLQSYKSSILISVLTTLIGLGVLIFAKHPALKSIASLSVIGITSAIVISFTLQPVLFNILVYFKDKTRKYPVELSNLIYTSIIFGSFGVLSIVLTILLPLFIILPVRMKVKRYMLRAAISFISDNIVKIYYFKARIHKVGFEKHSFDEPAVLISNHQSMIDILILLALSPKVIILTKDWVWNSPFFGFVVRFCGHINVSKGYDNVLSQIKKRTDEGCSLAVFPEGSRTESGKIKRFHKGGFYIAQKLDLLVQTILLHGVYDVFPKGAFLLSPGRIIVKRNYSFRIDKNNPRAYYQASKETCNRMRKEYHKMRNELETPFYNRHKILSNFIYKGPILENYMKVKLRLEKYYEDFDRLIPQKSVITDIGCGYGTMSFMLSLLSSERKIYAFDYDSEKIEVASNCELMNRCSVEFKAADVAGAEFVPSDVFLISDVLHYMPQEKRSKVLCSCIKKLNDGGKIIIRDGDESLKHKRWGTRLSEFFSTNFGFNKTISKLSFFSKDFIESIARENEMTMEIVNSPRLTSNRIFILKRIDNGPKI